MAARPDGVGVARRPVLSKFAGRVSDSGEGRWTLQAAIDEGVPAPVLSAALFGRFESRGAAEYADKLMSAMRFEFGGHHEKPRGPNERRPSDAIVFFGATGDLAYKQIFPALLGLVRDEGVERPDRRRRQGGLGLDQFKARAKDSLDQAGGVDPASFAKLASLLRYVDGDYNDPHTFAAPEAGARRGEAAAALSRDPSVAVRRRRVGARQGGLAENARLVVEKPFGTTASRRQR